MDLWIGNPLLPLSNNVPELLVTDQGPSIQQLAGVLNLSPTPSSKDDVRREHASAVEVKVTSSKHVISCLHYALV
jgi:hypothetical protein